VPEAVVGQAEVEEAVVGEAAAAAAARARARYKAE
jgi:hypothetical protein